MNPTILAAGILPNVTFTVGGASQQLAYNIGVNPVTVPQDSLHVLKLILQIKSPSGFVMYQNAGWNTSSFTSPDSLTGAYDLPTLTGVVTPESGEYQINIQAEYIDSTSAPVTTNATVNYLSSSLCVSCLPNPAFNAVTNCAAVIYTITDITNYALKGYSLVNVSRVITAVPPTGSGQPTATGTLKVLQIDNGSEGNGILWNGVYTLGLASTATYLQGSTTIVQTLTLSQEDTVSCLDPRCVMLCILDKLNTEYINARLENPKHAPAIGQRLLLGVAELVLVNQAISCGEPFENYIANFQTVTDVTFECTCCDDNVPTGPVMPIPSCTTGGSPGAAGAPGSVWYNGSGVPASNVGINGDYYLDNVSGNYYQKVSGAWVLKGNLDGPQGIQGLTGQNGQSGASLIWAPSLNLPFTGHGSGITFTPGVIPGACFQSEGDTVRVNMWVNNPALGDGYIQFSANSTVITDLQVNAQSLNTYVWYVEVAITLHSPSSNVWVLQVRSKATVYLGGATVTFFEAESLLPVLTIITGYTPLTDVPFIVDFNNATADGVLTFIEGISEKVGLVMPRVVPIYTNPTGGSTYTNVTLANIPNSNFAVYLDGLIQTPSIDYTYATNSTQGTITWLGTAPVAGSRLTIIPI